MPGVGQPDAGRFSASSQLAHYGDRDYDFYGSFLRLTSTREVPMIRYSFLSGFLLAVLCAGCGGGGANNPPTNTVTNAPQAFVNGNFAMTAVSQVVSNTSFIGGNVQTDAAGHFSGVLHIAGSNCFGVTTDIPFTGTISGLTLSATSSAVNGQIITVNVMISADGKSIISGSYSINGGCAGGDHGTVTGFQMQAFTGGYTGGFNVGKGTFSMFVPLTQQASADSDGVFRFGNTVAETVDGATGCGFGSFGATLVTTSSFAAGNALVLTLNVFDGSANTVATVTFVGVASDSSAKSVTGTFSVVSGNCSGSSGTGTLSHP